MDNTMRVFKGVNRTIRSGEIVNQVYMTDDYSIFRLSKFNRNVIITKEMLKQAEEGFIAPIIVNEQMIIIDGQNRFLHSKEVGVPVQYMIEEGLTEKDITRMNTNQRKWGLKDFVESYANQGKEEYVKLIDLVNQRISSGITNIVQTAYDATGALDNANKKIKEGTFEFHHYEKTVEFLQYLKQFREKTKTPKRSKVESALYGLFRLEGFDKKRLITKVLENKLDEEIRVKSPSHTEALKMLVDAYNHKLSKHSEKYIHYHITSDGRIIFETESQYWTKEKTDQ